MKYNSTRGEVTGCSFKEALFSGYASDGGIFLPELIPKVDMDVLKNIMKGPSPTYPQITKNVLELFVGKEVAKEEIDVIVDKALSSFSIPEKVKFSKLSQDLNVVELFHGPSLAFKDLALSIVGQFMDYFLAKDKEHVTIIVGTSGDTGSAAIEAVRRLSLVDIIVLYPKGLCTDIQERQMTTVLDENVHIFEVEGSSDDLDVPIRQCFKDTDFVEQHHLCSINSINWCRILVQIAHHIWTYLQAEQKELEICVPTGALGNITAGYIAYMMGLPIKLVACVNSNDIVHRTFTNGDYSADHLKKTIAPAMDILEPYNLERILYLASNGDTTMVKDFQHQVETNGKASINPEVLNKIQNVIQSCCVSDEELLSAMKRCSLENNGYVICPHTASAVHYHYKHSHGQTKRACIATASPLKFESAVTKAGLEQSMPEDLKDLLKKETKYTEMAKGNDWLNMLKTKIVDISKKYQAS